MAKVEFESSEGLSYSGSEEKKQSCKCGGNCQCKTKQEHVCECGGNCNCK